jgi:hypothetical protein
LKLKIKYIGNDEHYFEELKKRFNHLYPDFEFTFQLQMIDQDFDPVESYIETFKENLNILYIDYSHELETLILFTKLFNQNNVARLVSTVGLYTSQKQDHILKRAYLAGVRIHHYKTQERHDVVYDPLALLSVDLPKKPAFFRADMISELQIHQQARIGYIDTEMMRIETNCPLKLKDLIEVDDHLLSSYSPSKKFIVIDGGDSNLYYNMRYWYELAFTYEKDPLFYSTDYPYRDYIYYKKRPHQYQGNYNELEEDYKTYKTRILKAKDPVEHWVITHQGDQKPKKVKVLALDHSLNIARELGNYTAKDFALNIQPYLPADRYQIKRTYPHLICIQYDEKINNKAEVISIVELVKKIPDYNPYIVIFGDTEDKEQAKIDYGYEKILPFKDDLNLEEIKILANRLNKDLTQVSDTPRVYCTSKQDNNIVEIKRKANLVALTESVVYLQANYDIPMYTVFRLTAPVDMLVTILPHRKHSSMDESWIYRGLIHGITAENKAKIRKYLNEMIQKNLKNS